MTQQSNETTRERELREKREQEQRERDKATQLTQGREVTPPPEQCKYTVGSGLGRYVRCSLPETHPSHHIAFDEKTDLASVTWVRGAMQESVLPDTNTPTPQERNKEWARKARERQAS